jgi:hypothetical protein
MAFFGWWLRENVLPYWVVGYAEKIIYRRKVFSFFLKFYVSKNRHGPKEYLVVGKWTKKFYSTCFIAASPRSRKKDHQWLNSSDETFQFPSRRNSSRPLFCWDSYWCLPAWTEEGGGLIYIWGWASSQFASTSCCELVKSIWTRCHRQFLLSYIQVRARDRIAQQPPSGDHGLWICADGGF